jgi:hypothetical protein
VLTATLVPHVDIDLDDAAAGEVVVVVPGEHVPPREPELARAADDHRLAHLGVHVDPAVRCHRAAPVLAGFQDHVHGQVRHDAALRHAHGEPLRGADAPAAPVRPLRQRVVQHHHVPELPRRRQQPRQQRAPSGGGVAVDVAAVAGRRRGQEGPAGYDPRGGGARAGVVVVHEEVEVRGGGAASRVVAADVDDGGEEGGGGDEDGGEGNRHGDRWDSLRRLRLLAASLVGSWLSLAGYGTRAYIYYHRPLKTISSRPMQPIIAIPSFSTMRFEYSTLTRCTVL